MLYKKSVLFSLSFLLPLVTSCKNSTNGNDIEHAQEKTDVHKYFTNIAETVNEFNTGASLTFQCNKGNYQIINILNYGNIQKNGSIVTNQTLFEIGSNTKSFLAVVALQLEDEGMLDISYTVGAYLPEYSLWKDITLKQLLNMTSGIIDYTKHIEKGKVLPQILDIIKTDPKHKFTYNEILNFVKDIPLNTKLEYSYSNTNYVILAKIIEKVTNNSLKNAIYERIIKPLNLQHTYYIEHLAKNEISVDDYKNLAIGHYTFPEKKDAILPEGSSFIDFSFSYSIGTGSMLSTSVELNTYLQALFSGKLLSKKQLGKLLTPVDIETGKDLPEGVNEKHLKGYGLGMKMMYDPVLNEVIYYHSAGTLGFTSYMYYLPKSQISFTNFFNSTSFINPRLDTYIKNLPKQIKEQCDQYN
ncbi:serine hydrolase domain-containing protein [Pigmentibacter ruber]